MSKEPEEKSMFGRIWDKWIGTKVKNTQMAGMAMLPNWDDLQGLRESPRHRRAEIMLEKINQVCYCVKNCFYNDKESNLREVIHVVIHLICNTCCLTC